MTVDHHQFWNLLTASRLLPATRVQGLFSEFAQQTEIPRQAPALAQWLVQQGALTGYQSQILLAGHAQPFYYGAYRVQQKLEQGPLQGAFAAAHRSTGYPVLLEFLPGQQPGDLQRWRQIQDRAAAWAKVNHPALAGPWEAVVLPHYRFVVGELPSGKTLSQRLPEKARLNWQQACAVLAQVAQGLQAAHEQGLAHGAVGLDTVWLGSQGRAQLRVDVFQTPAGSSATPESDRQAIGRLLFRLISGREAGSSQARQIDLAAKYGLPADLVELIGQLAWQDPPGGPQTAGEIAVLLGLYSGKAEELQQWTAEAARRRTAFSTALQQLLPGQPEGVAAPSIETGEEVEPLPEAETFTLASQQLDAEQRQQKMELARQHLERRRRRKWTMPAMIFGALALFAALLGGMAYLAQTPLPVADSTPGSGDGSAPVGTGSDSGTAATAGPGTTPTGLVQQLIEDDESTLWESPTSGTPLVLNYLPTAPKLILHLRPAELLAQPEGPRLLQSLGPKFTPVVQQYLQPTGLELEDFQRLRVSFHEVEQQYRPFAWAELTQTVPLSRLQELWGQPAAQQTPGGKTIWEAGEVAFWPIPANASDQPAEPGSEADPGQPQIGQFLFGNSAAVAEVADSGGIPVSGGLDRVAPFTDQQRHASLMFLRPSLFNDAGQAWMGPQLKDFNRELSVMLPDEVRAGVVSMHLDEGSYLEIMLDRLVDMSAADLRDRMVADLRDRRDRLIQLVARIQPNPYWDQVRAKYATMLTDVTQNMRWGIEQGEVLGNCWLPPMAPHNLLAASELVSAFAAGAAPLVTAPARKVPQSLEELLASRRNLDIANPPDLNLLMSDLQEEIESDYGKLPFPWSIKLMGGDLEQDGITKNQRPGALVMENKSLAEILTEIMISANPSKDITGPADPECKLIWVVAENPDQPGEPAILITTRAAAAERSYQLPPAFRPADERP